jgi:hypothetical protein
MYWARLIPTLDSTVRNVSPFGRQQLHAGKPPYCLAVVAVRFGYAVKRQMRTGFFVDGVELLVSRIVCLGMVSSDVTRPRAVLQNQVSQNTTFK